MNSLYFPVLCSFSACDTIFWRIPLLWLDLVQWLPRLHKWHNVQCTLMHAFSLHQFIKRAEQKLKCKEWNRWFCSPAHSTSICPRGRRRWGPCGLPFPSAHITRCAHLPKAERELSVETYVLFIHRDPWTHDLLYRTLPPSKMWIQGVSHDKPSQPRLKCYWL